MSLPFSPLSIIGFARSILARIKTFQQQGTTLNKNESKDRRTNSDPDRKITYASDGRSGKVIYKSRETSFEMYYEFGGGNVVASIDIPSPENWRRHTGLPLEQREEVLNFIGQQVARDQTSGGSFRIEGNWMNIYA